MRLRALLALCGLTLAVSGVTAQFGTAGLSFVPRFTRLLRQDNGVSSYLLPTQQPSLCSGGDCCQQDSYASPYDLVYLNKTQQLVGSRTYTTFFFSWNSKRSCRADLDQNGCCSGTADNVWVDVDPSLMVRYVAVNKQFLPTAEQSDYGLKLGSLALTPAAATDGIPVEVTVEGAADSLCPLPDLAPIAGYCELVVQGGAGGNPNACCPTTITAATTTPYIPGPTDGFQCMSSIDGSAFELKLETVAASAAPANGNAYVEYGFRLVRTSTCKDYPLGDCCDAQLTSLNLKVTLQSIASLTVGGEDWGGKFKTTPLQEPNSASYQKLYIQGLNFAPATLPAGGVPIVVRVKVPPGVAGATVDLCDAAADSEPGVCNYWLDTADPMCCAAAPAAVAGPPEPPVGCTPKLLVPAADTSFTLQYYDSSADAAASTSTFTFLLANHNGGATCDKPYCADVCTWTLYVNADAAAVLKVLHEDEANANMDVVETGAGAAVTFKYGPAGMDASNFNLVLPGTGKRLADLCRAGALPGQGAHACGAVVRSQNFYSMVYFDDTDCILCPSVGPVTCPAPNDLAGSCLQVPAACSNTLLDTSVFRFNVSTAAAGAQCTNPAGNEAWTTVHLVLSSTAVDALSRAPSNMVAPTTGLRYDRESGVYWTLPATRSSQIALQLPASMPAATMCRQGVTPAQPAGSCVVEVTGGGGCFLGYVTPKELDSCAWITAPGPAPSGSRGTDAATVVPAVVLPVFFVLLLAVLLAVYLRRRRERRYALAGLGDGELDAPLSRRSLGSMGDDLSVTPATASDIQVRVKTGNSTGGASHGGAGPSGARR